MQIQFLQLLNAGDVVSPDVLGPENRLHTPALRLGRAGTEKEFVYTPGEPQHQGRREFLSLSPSRPWRLFVSLYFRHDAYNALQDFLVWSG
jgi:hypothetical protein